MRDDFSKDVRGDYTPHGDVSWKNGKLTLGSRASIQCGIDGVARVLKPTVAKASPPTQSNRTVPFYWAVFQLSGDWQ